MYDPRVKQMDEAIKESGAVPGDTVVYRGVSLDPENSAHQYVLQNLKKGYSFDEYGFSSTSIDAKVADDFALGGDYGNVQVIFSMKVDGKVAGLSIESGLSEIVLQRYLRYNIDEVSTRMKGGIKIINVTGWLGRLY